MDCKLERISSFIVRQTCFEKMRRTGDFQEIGNFHEDQTESPKKPIHRDRLLLKMTLIQRMFQKLSVDQYNCGHLGKICELLVAQCNLLSHLINCLGSSDQLIAFSASKCLVKVVVGLPLAAGMAEWFRDKLLNFDPREHNCWRLLYTMEFLRKVVRFCHDNCDAVPVQTGSEIQICECGSKKQKHTVSKAAVINLALVWDRWVDIQPLYIPFLNNSWRISFQELSTCDLRTILASCSSTNSALHQNAVSLGVKDESAIISFLMFLHEVVKYIQMDKKQGDEISSVTCGKDADRFTSSNSAGTDQQSMAGSGLSDECEVVPENHQWSIPAEVQVLLKLIPDLVLLLHMPSLSAMCTKTVLNVLWQVHLPSESITPCRSWTGNHLLIVHSSAALISGVHCCLLKNIPQTTGCPGFGGQDCGSLHDKNPPKPDPTCLRKLSLLLLKASLVILEHDASEPKGIVLEAIMLWSHSLEHLLHGNLGKETSSQEVSEECMSCGLLIELFSDQDDELVEVLLSLLRIYQKIQSYPDECQTPFLQLFNPHHLFISLLDSVRFDHSVLLDFLISPETCFLRYLSLYLHFMLGNLQFFTASIKHYEDVLHRKLEGDSREYQEEIPDLHKLLSSDNATISRVENNLGHEQCSGLSGEPSTIGKLLGGLQDIATAYTSGESSEESEGDHEMAIERAADVGASWFGKVSEESLEKKTAVEAGTGHYPHRYAREANPKRQADSISHVSRRAEQFFLQDKSKEGDLPEMMDRLMAVLIRLRLSIERLQRGNLFPYNAEPLLRTMRSVEMLYDDC